MTKLNCLKAWKAYLREQTSHGFPLSDLTDFDTIWRNVPLAHLLIIMVQ